MNIPATSTDFEIEAYIAARDADRRSDQEIAQIATKTTEVLATLDTELARHAASIAQAERITRYLAVFQNWASQNDWPGFTSMQVMVGTKRKQLCRGFLGYRTIPDIQNRGVFTQTSLGITSRGEFVSVGKAHGRVSRIIDTSDRQFAPDRFERMLEGILRYYKIDIPS